MGTARSLFARLVAVVAVAGALVVGGAGTAAAGGPTSVLLASPYAGAAAGLYYTDTDYARLQTLLGGPDLPAGSPPPSAAAGSPYVTATWLIHDVDAWRIDRIFLVGDEVWIVSEMSGDGGPLTGDGMFPGQTGNAGAVWHRAADPVTLTALLSARGVTPASVRPLADTSLADPAPIQRAAASSPSPTTTGWAWAIGGLLAGLVIGGSLVRVTRARQAAPRTGSSSRPDPVRMQPID